MKRFVLAFSLLVLAALAILLLAPAEDDSVVSYFDADANQGGAVFSSKRLWWEWQQLRDPANGEIPYGIRKKELAFAATLPRRDGGAGLMKQSGVASNLWRHRGPWNVGGRTRGVAFDISGQDTILAGGASGGVWRSSDGGNSWVLTTTPEQAFGVTTLVQDPRPGKNHIWYFGTGESFNSASGSGSSYYVGDGLFKSTDNGRSWHHLLSSGSGTPEQRDVVDITWNIAVDPSNLTEDVVLVAVDGAIRRSTDGGATWAYVLGNGTVNTTRYVVGYADVAVTSQGVVYATIGSKREARGIYRSSDGVSFTNITPEEFPPDYNRMVIGLTPSNKDFFYLIAETPGHGHSGEAGRFYHSLWCYTWLAGDGSGQGGQWEDRSENIPEYGPGLGDFNSQGGYCMVISPKPDNEDVVFLGGTNLYRSTDGFRTRENTAWVGGYRNYQYDNFRVSSPILEEYFYKEHHPDVHAVSFSPTNPNILLTGSDGGVHITTDILADSIQWTSLNNGYHTTQFYTVAINHTEPQREVIVGGLQDNGSWRSLNGTQRDPWTFTSSDDGGVVAVSDGGRRLYVSKQLGVLYAVDLDEDGKQVGFRRIDIEDVLNPTFFSPFAIDPNQSDVVYLPGNGNIYRNLDITQIPLGNVKRVQTGWDILAQQVVSIPSFISAMAVTDKNPSHRLWFSDNNSHVFRIDNANGGNTEAVNVSSQDFPANAYISCIGIDPSNGDHVVVVFSNYGVQSLFQTTDAGETWSNVSGNLEENTDGSGNGPSCRWVTILPHNGTMLYLVGTSTGLYSTTSLQGENTIWVQEGAESIGHSVVPMVDGRASDGLVVVATHGAGIFSTNLATSSVSAGQTPVGTTAIERIAPNPLRTTTAITFRVDPLQESKAISIMLYDLSGRRVKQFDVGQLQGGLRTEELELSDLQNGTYFLRLVANANVVAEATVMVQK